MQEELAHYLQPHVLVIDEVGYLSYGPDAANVLFPVVNERHQRWRPMLFTTNKPPLTAWEEVLHNHNLAEVSVDRVLERGRLLSLDGPSYRPCILIFPLTTLTMAHTNRTEFPETIGRFSGTHSFLCERFLHHPPRGTIVVG